MCEPTIINVQKAMRKAAKAPVHTFGMHMVKYGENDGNCLCLGPCCHDDSGCICRFCAGKGHIHCAEANAARKRRAVILARAAKKRAKAAAGA